MANGLDLSVFALSQNRKFVRAGGQGVIVVEENKSKVSEVKQAVDLLPETMAVGFVLNKVTDPTETQGYGYYYGSGA